MRPLFFALTLVLGTIAQAEVRTQLNCFNPVTYEGLTWNFTVISAPSDAHPGFITGSVENLMVVTPTLPGQDPAMQVFNDSVQSTTDATFWYEEGYDMITIVPTDAGDNVTKVSVKLENPLADNLGYAGQDMKGKSVLGTATVKIEFATDAPVTSRPMDCKMINL